MPSPIRLRRRCTRKKPTAGASRPTTMPAPYACRMNSRSSMDVRRVVPDTWQVRRRPVVDDALAHEHDPLDEVLDRAELVRHVQDRYPELRPEALQQRGDRLLRLHVHPGGRLVEREQIRVACQRLRDERALLLAARERAQAPVRA